MHPRQLRVIGAGLVLLATASRVSSAQLEALNALLGRITSINASAQYGYLYPKPADLTVHRPSGGSKWDGLSGYGLEFSFQFYEFLSKKGAANKSLDTTLTLVTVEERNRAGTTETRHIHDVAIEHNHKAGDRIAILEVALGYSQAAGFYATDPTFDLRGSVRELPSLSFYGTFFPDSPLSPYVGVRSGLAQLNQTRIYDSTSTGSGPVYTVDAQTFQAGAVGGLVFEIGSIDFFAEGAYMFRNFPSLDVKGATNTIPSRFPRGMNLSGLYLQTGIQIEIGKDKK